MIQILAILLSLFVTPATAQCTGQFPAGTFCGNPGPNPAPPKPIVAGAGIIIGPGSTTVGDIATWGNTTGTLLADQPPTTTMGWTPATNIGVDCTGTLDSSSAIQTWVNANLNGGRLQFPNGCQVKIASTITVTDGFGIQFASATAPGQPNATLNWTGGNGGNSCTASFANCKYMFDFEHTDHPIIERLNFAANETGNGWLADSACPDGFLKFDGFAGGVHIGTAGHIIGNSFANNCVNPNFVGINISQTATNNHENYLIYDNNMVCSVKAANLISRDGVSNGTTTLTAASGPFVSSNVGQRIRITHQGGEFDTTIAALVSSTQVTLAAAVPWSDTSQLMYLGQGFGVGLRNGASQNALQQVVYKFIASDCEVGILQQGGNIQVTQQSGTFNDFGHVIGSFSAGITENNYLATEGDLVDLYVGQSDTSPVTITHWRGSNGSQLATGFGALGSQVTITNSSLSFGPSSLGSNINYLTPSYTYKINSIGTVVGGSGYTTGTYTSVPMLLASGVPTPTVTGSGNDIGIKATVVVAGGAVTTVTITTPGTFFNFPLPMTSGFNAGGNIVTWSLTAAPSAIGGTGSGFSVPITSFVTNTISGTVTLLSENNNWVNGTWTYSEFGFPSFAVNSQIVSINDQWDNVTQIGQNIVQCFSSIGTSIQGPNTCKKIVNAIKSGLGMDVQLTTFTSANGPTVGYRAEGTVSGTPNTSFTGFQNLPTTGRMSTYYAGFENAAVSIDLTNSPTTNYGYIARQMTSYVGGTMPNVYGFYAEGQKITNVTAGWGFYSAGATDGNFFAGPVLHGNNSLTVPAGGIGMGKITADGVATGAAGGKIELVCGTNAGTAKLIAYAGTSTTPVTIVDNIGSGVTGC